MCRWGRSRYRKQPVRSMWSAAPSHPVTSYDITGRNELVGPLSALWGTSCSFRCSSNIFGPSGNNQSDRKLKRLWNRSSGELFSSSWFTSSCCTSAFSWSCEEDCSERLWLDGTAEGRGCWNRFSWDRKLANEEKRRAQSSSELLLFLIRGLSPGGEHRMSSPLNPLIWRR